jgi:hypothetical protein
MKKTVEVPKVTEGKQALQKGITEPEHMTEFF